MESRRKMLDDWLTYFTQLGTNKVIGLDYTCEADVQKLILQTEKVLKQEPEDWLKSKIHKAANDIMAMTEETSKSLNGPRFCFEEYIAEVEKLITKALMEQE